MTLEAALAAVIAALESAGITTASEIPEEVGQLYVKAFAKIGGNELRLMHIPTREMAEDPSNLERIWPSTLFARLRPSV